jgi:glyoxylase-like metal-dependent hydrolase (beta-lactamase superfamily II)
MANVNRHIQRIEDHIWRVSFKLPGVVNCWLVSDGDGLTLVDAAQPWNAPAILEAAESLGLPIRRIVITHAHPDHAGSAAKIARTTGATVFAHATEIPYLTGKACMADLPGYWMCRALLGAGRTLRVLNPPAIDSVEAVQDGDVIGGLQVLHTPGHTPGSISLWNASNGALFCGDNISNTMNILRLNLSHFTLDWDRLKQSLRAYSNYPARLLLPGHGPAYRSDDAIKDALALLKA